jgi:hypothetical protein
MILGNGGLVFGQLVQSGQRRWHHCEPPFTAVSLRSETETRRISNLLTLTEGHRDIWSIVLEHPGLARVLDASVDLSVTPVTLKESPSGCTEMWPGFRQSIPPGNTGRNQNLPFWSMLVLQESAGKGFRRSSRIRGLVKEIIAMASIRKTKGGVIDAGSSDPGFFADSQETKHTVAQVPRHALSRGTWPPASDWRLP